MIKWLLAALLLLAPSLTLAQNQGQIVPSGRFTTGHTIRCQNSTCTVAVDGGGAAGSNLNGQGYLTEIGITNTGTPFCINDALINAVGGYHQLCLGANALGGGLISYNAYGGASALGLNFIINGATFPFPGGAGTGNVVGPSPNPTAGNIALWNGGLTQIDHGSLTTATTDGNGGQIQSATGIPSATTIYNWATGGAFTDYDTFRSVLQMNTGSTVTNMTGYASYIDNELASLAGTSRNGVNYFGVGVAGVNNVWQWGVNTICTDSKNQTSSALTGVNCLGYEADFNIFSTSTIVNGVELVGGSGVQPTTANGFVANVLDISGAQRAKWSASFVSAAGAANTAMIIGQQSPSGTSINSQTLLFGVFDSGAVARSFQMEGTPTGFVFSHLFGATIFWSFDNHIELPSNSAYEVNFDPIVTADGSHNVSLGVGASIATVGVGNNSAAVAIHSGTTFEVAAATANVLDYGITTSGAWTFGAAKLNLNAVTGAGASSKTVCVDASGNVLLKSGAC